MILGIVWIEFEFFRPAFCEINLILLCDDFIGCQQLIFDFVTHLNVSGAENALPQKI